MKSLRVLVVDDDVMIGVLLGEMLSEMGHVCSVMASKAEALASAAVSMPELMIIDVELGDGSGEAAMEEIQRLGLVPHVFISGDRSRIGRLSRGAVAIAKPFREAELLRAMHDALAR
jgi:DNA-binding response OmpR family regulator